MGLGSHFLLGVKHPKLWTTALEQKVKKLLYDQQNICTASSEAKQNL